MAEKSLFSRRSLLMQGGAAGAALGALTLPASAVAARSASRTCVLDGLQPVVLTISGTMTMEVEGSSFTLPFGTEAGAAQPFAVCIYPDGAARLTFPLMSRDGFARDWVEGTLTRQPLP